MVLGSTGTPDMPPVPTGIQYAIGWLGEGGGGGGEGRRAEGRDGRWGGMEVEEGWRRGEKSEEGNRGREGEMRGRGMRQSNRHHMAWDYDKQVI